MPSSIVAGLALTGLLASLAMPVVVAASIGANHGARDHVTGVIITTLLPVWLLNAIIAGVFFGMGFLIGLSGRWPL